MKEIIKGVLGLTLVCGIIPSVLATSDDEVFTYEEEYLEIVEIEDLIIPGAERYVITSHYGPSIIKETGTKSWGTSLSILCVMAILRKWFKRK